jgi:hypothetical protein
MKKRAVLVLIIPAIVGWFLYPGLTGVNIEGADIEFGQGKTIRLLSGEKSNFSKNLSPWGLPSQYAQTSWPAIHRDSRNSNYLPFTTASTLKLKWHALEDEYSAVVTPVVTGPEGNIYFTTGKDASYGNLHAFDREGNELWRSYYLDIGALGSSPLIDQEGDLYLADTDEFFGFHPDGSLKWKYSGLDGPFASNVFSPDGHIIGISRKGIVYVFDRRNGQLAAHPLELPDQPPGDHYKTSAPPGLWEGMVSSGGEGISIDEIFNCLMGFQFKVTNTPVVNPANGRIYIIGNIKTTDHSNTVQGRFYGIDFIPGSGDTPGVLQLAFQTRTTGGSGASPAVSSDGSHIYVLDGPGTLYAFTKDGDKAWRLHVGVMPASPAIGPDGTIYCASDSTLYAVKDSGSSGSMAWKMDFTQEGAERLPDSPPSWVEENSYRREVKPTVKCNSVVSVSKNYLYLTISAGYELRSPRSDQTIASRGLGGGGQGAISKSPCIPVSRSSLSSGDALVEKDGSRDFFPLKSLLIVVAPPGSAENAKSEPVISSITELPDTSEGIITLDKTGTVFCSHASIVSSVAYYDSQKMGFDFQKPVGGVSVLSPE